jgi:hypothetical protein
VGVGGDGVCVDCPFLDWCVMGLYERIALEFCLVTVALVLLYEFVRMWRERRRTRKELWRIFYERRQRRRNGGG